MVRHISAPIAVAMGEGLPARIMVAKPIPAIGATPGMIFERSEIAWVHPELDNGLLAWRVREGLATGELKTALPATPRLTAA